MKEDLKIRECGGCRFCCWSFNVDVPHPTLLDIIEPKKKLSNCAHECEKGCTLHGKKEQPNVCKVFHCPYIRGENIHKPDVFQDELKDLKGNIGNYIPAVLSSIDIAATKELIRKTRTIPAYILIGNEWKEIIMPLDRDENGTWLLTGERLKPWEELYKRYNQALPEDIKKHINTVMV